MLAAPLAGGPGSPELLAAAARAGSLGFLGAGYKTPEAFAEERARLRSDGVPHAVNLFVPNPLPVERTEFVRYAAEIAPEAERLGVALQSEAREDDDWWAEKLDVLLADPPPLVSFTFGIPAQAELAALRRAGSLLVQTVTTPEEARAAAAAGVDALAVQASTAGGHFATMTPAAPLPVTPLPELIAVVRSTVELPLMGAGGISSPRAASEALRAGASAVLAGTALLLSVEAGTAAAHRVALRDHARESVITRAFTGRPARGLRNGFIERHEATAPLGFPAIHHLTSPLRRAAAAREDPELLHLWAGTGFREAREAPAGEILLELSGV